MKTVLLLGAGRSSSSLVVYLLRLAQERDWRVMVGDVSLQQATERIGQANHAQAIAFDIRNEQECLPVIASADVVISLLPPHFHPVVARMCLQKSKHLLTASYVSEEMNALHAEALSRDLLFLNECGLDPGIDHMSAVKIINTIHAQGGKVISFESFTGGLIAPETDPENPWRYKFTWNPRNVVMAGQGTAKWLEEGKVKYIPYQQLFQRITSVHVPGYGDFEGYANRDSLKYLNIYHLPDIQTMLRGTLRYPGFCSAWNLLVQLGCCDDSYVMENADRMTHVDFINAFLPGPVAESPVARLEKVFHLQPENGTVKRLMWSGLFSDEPIGLRTGSPAQLLEHILNKRWALAPQDKDMIVMLHRFRVSDHGKEKVIQSSLVVKGEDSLQTAMAKTVGLPLGIAAKLVLENKIKVRGVVIPTLPEFYNPVLSELENHGIRMVDEVC